MGSYNFEGSYNGVDLSEYATKQELDDAAAAWSAGYTPKGPASVSTINGLTGQQNGDVYILTDDGTVNPGSLTVSEGDQIAWDADNSVWYKFIEYASKAVQDDLVKKVNPIASYWYKENESSIIPDHIRNNAYLNLGSSYTTNSDYQLVSYPVKEGGKIRIKGAIDVITRISFTNNETQVTNAYIISTVYTNNTATYDAFDLVLTVPSGAKWVQMSQKKTFDYVITEFNLQSEQITRYNTLYVSTSGNDTTGDGSLSKPFATILHANEVITDNSKYNRYKIKVLDGTYTDLQTTYAGSTPRGYEGVICKPWVTYEGNIEHPENVVIEWDGADGYAPGVFNYDDYGFYKCVFHIPGAGAEGSAAGFKKVCGFTINAKNTRYALHIEMSGYGDGVEWVVSDCLINWDGVPDDPNKINDPPSAIGTGSAHFEKGLLKNCKVTNTSPVNRAFRNHDSEYKYDASRFREGACITFDSVDFGDGVVMFRTTHGDNNCDGFNRCFVHNCIGISDFTYTLSGGSTEVDWRADVKCSVITYNKFAVDGKLQ